MSKRTLTQFASAIVILNLLDGLFTVLFTNLGVATESNPIMKGALAVSPALFMATKLSLVSLGVLLLWRFGHRRSAMVALAGSAAMYAVVIGYHLTAATMLVATR
jgi:hypothetical protein